MVDSNQVVLEAEIGVEEAVRVTEDLAMLRRMERRIITVSGCY